MNDHGKSGFDVENEKPRSGSSVSSELPREAALFPAAANQHAAAAPRTFPAGPPKTSTEISRVAPVPGGAADDDDSPADNLRPGNIATTAPNVRRYGEPGDDQRPDRDGRLLDDARLDDVGLPDDDDRRDDYNGQCQRLAYRFNPRRTVVYAEATYKQPDDRDDPYRRRAALVEPAQEDEHPSSWAPNADRPATSTDNYGRHLGKSLFFAEDWSRPRHTCLPAAHVDVLARVLEDVLNRREAADVADMRRVISAKFRMHQAGIDRDLHEHRQRVSAALDNFAKQRRTDAAVMSEPLRFLRDGLMTLRLDMTKVNDRLCVLQ